MSPRELAELILPPGAAADVVEAIDDPAGQAPLGRALARWRYDPAPWGVRFTRADGAEVLALTVFDPRMADAYRGPRLRSLGTRVIALG